MRIDLTDILAVPVLSLVWAGLAWTSSRSINGGRPLSATQRKMFAYGIVWVLGGGYLVLGAIAFFSPPFHTLIALFVAWGALLSYIAWRRHRRSQTTLQEISTPAERRSHLRQGFAVVALLVTLIASTIEWGYVFGRQGHWLAALLWSAGVAGSILLAYGNRRTTVMTTLRAYLVLMVIGVIAERQAAPLIFLAIAVGVYFSLEKLWKKPQPPVLDLNALAERSSPDRKHSDAELKRH